MDSVSSGPCSTATGRLVGGQCPSARKPVFWLCLTVALLSLLSRQAAAEPVFDIHVVDTLLTGSDLQPSVRAATHEYGPHAHLSYGASDGVRYAAKNGDWSAGLLQDTFTGKSTTMGLLANFNLVPGIVHHSRSYTYLGDLIWGLFYSYRFYTYDPWTHELIASGQDVGLRHAAVFGEPGVMGSYDDAAVVYDDNEGFLRYSMREGEQFWTAHWVVLDSTAWRYWPSMAGYAPSDFYVCWSSGEELKCKYGIDPATEVVDSPVDWWSSIARYQHGSPHICYALRKDAGQGVVLSYAVKTGDTWEIERIAAAGSNVYSGALTLDDYSNPHIVYLQEPHHLKLAVKVNGSWSIYPVDTSDVFVPPGAIGPARPSISITSWAATYDKGMHAAYPGVLGVMNAFARESDQPTYSSTHLVSCPAGDALSTTHVVNSRFFPCAGHNLTLSMPFAPDSLCSCPGAESYMSMETDESGSASFYLRWGGAIGGWIRLYAESGSDPFGLLVERSLPLAGFDLDNDCIVTEADLSILLSLYGTRDPRADYNFDGIVDSADSLLFTEHLGHRCIAFKRGDVDGDGDRDSADPALNLCAQFADCELTCPDAADVNDDGEITITDVVRSLCSGSVGCDQPPDPYWSCGPDPTEDDLGCGCPNICMPCEELARTLITDSDQLDWQDPVEKTIDGEGRSKVLSLALGPNPTNGAVSVSYGLHVNSRVKVVIYNVAGKAVSTLVDRSESAGRHKVVWNGTDEENRDVPNGLYFCRITTASSSEMHKIVLLR